MTTATSVQHDPMHELANVLHQLEDDNGNFVLDYSEAYPATTPDERQQIMGYFAPGSLPALHELARHFTICDHWYSSVPGPTWANRFFVHSGTSLGRVQMPEDLNDSLRHPGLYFGYDQDTIYDRLNERGVPWRIYHGDIPQSLVLSHQRTVQNARRYEFMDVFFSDARGQEERFPAFCFIEPCYYWPGQNDDHPPHTTLRAQALLGNVYNALRQNDRLWNSTLLVVLYDEHGGFYDHVPPPAAVPPDGHTLPNFALRPARRPGAGPARLALGRADGHQDRVRPHQPAQVPDREVGPRPADGASGAGAKFRLGHSDDRPASNGHAGVRADSSDGGCAGSDGGSRTRPTVVFVLIQ